MKNNIIFEEIISDIAGNLFLIQYYTDLEGNIKKEIIVYDPNKNNLKNKNLVYNNNSI